MILDLPKFVEKEQPLWRELAKLLDRIEADVTLRLDLPRINRLHYLYERTSADLAEIDALVSEPELRSNLEALVSRAYGEIHGTRAGAARFAPWHWISRTFPQTFRRRVRQFALAASIMAAGALFGGFALLLDRDAKPALLPFEHLQGSPADRVAEEERHQRSQERLEDGHQSFSAELMTHNTRVAIFSMAMGMSCGVGTMVLMFYNGVILGAVCADYVAAGQGVFLAGWLLPHGVIEIPSILIAGQAGLLLGGALIGWGTRLPLRARLRRILPDLLTLIGGVAVLLVWAGVMESFFSQYHEPVLPYALKIAIGLAEGLLLVLFLARAGRRENQEAQS